MIDHFGQASLSARGDQGGNDLRVLLSCARPPSIFYCRHCKCQMIFDAMHAHGHLHKKIDYAAPAYAKAHVKQHQQEPR